MNMGDRVHKENGKVRKGSDIRLLWLGLRVVKCIAWRLGYIYRLGDGE